MENEYTIKLDEGLAFSVGDAVLIEYGWRMRLLQIDEDIAKLKRRREEIEALHDKYLKEIKEAQVRYETCC